MPHRTGAIGDSASPKSILHLTFNHDRSLFAAGTTAGFKVCKTDPYTEVKNRQCTAAIGFVEIIQGSTFFVLVGGGHAPRLDPKKLFIWDDDQRKLVGSLSFRSPVKSVRIRHDRLVAVTAHHVRMFNLGDFRLVKTIETEENPKGLCEISQLGPMVIACLGVRKGQVRVMKYESKSDDVVLAHESAVAAIALTHSGHMLATASSKGTLIRIFKVSDGSVLHELRRGSEKAEIHSLCFSPSAKWLAVSSNKGTIHVFSLTTRLPPQQQLSASLFSFLKGVLPKYFICDWSLAQFRVQEGIEHVVTFGNQENTLLIVGADGRFYRCLFDSLTGGQMTQLEVRNFLQEQ